MDLIVYDEEEHRFVPWGVSLAAVLITAVLVGGLTLLLTRGSQDEALGGVGAPQAVEAPTGTATPSATGATPGQPSAAPSDAEGSSTATGTAPACETALARADVVLERSLRVGQALGEHTRIMDELLAKRLDAEQALDRTLPVLTTGAKDRDRLDQARAAYQEARQSCRE